MPRKNEAVLDAEPETGNQQPETAVSEGYCEIATELVQTSALNPRKDFDRAKLEELAASFRDVGLIEPIIVRPLPLEARLPGVVLAYELVAGERRLRAAGLAGMEKIPCIVRNYTDAQALQVSGIENLQREDLNAYEQAEWLAAMLERGGVESREALASRIGKSVRWVHQALQFLELGENARTALREGTISASHAALLARLQPADQRKVLEHCIEPEVVPNGATHETFPKACSVRMMDAYIKQNILLDLNSAPFSTIDPALVPDAPSCHVCPFNSGTNMELFEGLHKDVCTKPACYRAKCEASAAVKAASPDLRKKDKEVVISDENDSDENEKAEGRKAEGGNGEDRDSVRESGRSGSRERDESDGDAGSAGDRDEDDLTEDQRAAVEPGEGEEYEKEEARRVAIYECVVDRISLPLPIVMFKVFAAKLAEGLIDLRAFQVGEALGWSDVNTGQDLRAAIERLNGRNTIDMQAAARCATALALLVDTFPKFPCNYLEAVGAEFENWGPKKTPRTPAAQIKAVEDAVEKSTRSRKSHAKETKNLAKLIAKNKAKPAKKSKPAKKVKAAKKR